MSTVNEPDGDASTDPNRGSERLASLFEVARTAGLDTPFELYHRASNSVRVARGTIDGPDETSIGRDDGLALRVREPGGEGAVFVASSGCDDEAVRWLVERARHGYADVGGDGWPDPGSRLEDCERDERLPAPRELVGWLDRARNAFDQPDAGATDLRVEAAIVREHWVATGGLSATRSRSRAWAVANPEGRAAGRPLLIAARPWSALDHRGWKTLLSDRRWPGKPAATDMGGSWHFLFSPETAAILVDSLVRSVHAPTGPTCRSVGNGWRVIDDPTTPGVLGGAAFDDTGHPTSKLVLADGQSGTFSLGGPGTRWRPSYRDAPATRPSSLVVAETPRGLPERCVVVSDLAVHVHAPERWILECGGGLLERGSPGPSIPKIHVKTDPGRLVRRCVGTWGETRESWLGVRTPALIFSDPRR